MLPYSKIEAMQSEIAARNSRTIANQRQFALIGFGKKLVGHIASVIAKIRRDSRSRKVRPAV